MAPKSAPSLFHPKKKATNKGTAAVSPQKASSSTPPTTKKAKEEELEEEASLPDGPYQEFRLMSSALNGWKYDVMKFDSRKVIDISHWKAPIKLNRKEPRKDEPANTFAPEAVGPMLGPDGKPVVGADGRTVMVDAGGRPIHSAESYAAAKEAKANGTASKKKFQKKTRQVYSVPDAVRRLRREERYPWVMEDADKSEVWVGKMEDVGRSDTRAFFMPAANDIFKFVPAHRWYRFHKKMNHYVPTLEEAEKVLDKMKKNKDPEMWLLRNRNGQAPSAATSAIFKAESEGRAVSGNSSLVHSSGHSLGPGGRRLKAVDSGTDALFGGDDDDQDAERRRKREFGEEGDADEGVFDEEFADDEEKMDMDDKEQDEETKELEDRLKREYRSANKQREGFVDESDEESGEELNKEGKALKKLIRSKDKNHGYGSDDDSDPYASSVEEEAEELPVIPAEPAIPQQPPQYDTATKNQTSIRSQPVDNSRPSSPVAGLGGHSIVAKRATSPKVPKLKTNVSRGNSPLNGSRAASPTSVSHATSPVNGRATSPKIQSPNGTVPKPNNKRKATEDHTPGSPTFHTMATNGHSVPPKPKKRKAAASTVVPAGELEDRMVVDWLRSSPAATTRDCIHHFTPYLTDEAKKAKFTKLIQQVAQLKGGVLVLRNSFRSGSVAPSRAASPAA